LSILISCDSFERWQAQLQDMLGETRISLDAPDSSCFQASILSANASGFHFIGLSGTIGALKLHRRQSSNHAVLWLPFTGYSQAFVNTSSTPLQARPGQALWLAPGDVLDGLAAEGCTGFSILIPKTLLDQLPGDYHTRSAALNPFRIERRSSEIALLRAARLCLEAVVNQPSWLAASAGELWAALGDHALAQDSDHDLHSRNDDIYTVAERSSSKLTADRFIDMVNHELDHNPRAQFSLEQLSLALAVSPRTLQLHLKKELLASPREVWLQLQAEH
jgi:hypothetical protein